MRIHCHQCRRPVTPDLPEFDFEGYVLCPDCAAENAGRADAGEEGFVEAEPEPVPYAADIAGGLTFRVHPGAMDGLREQVEATLGQWADEAVAGLAVLRDAYQSMSPVQRGRFGELVSSFLLGQVVAHEGVVNPYAAFHLGFRVNPLDPAEAGSLYQGLYVGRGWRDISHWLELAGEAVSAWDRGGEYQPTRDEVLRRLSRPPEEG